MAQTRHADPLVRSTAARVLDQPAMSGNEDARRALAPLLDDPFRVVRHAAAWSLRDRLDPQSGAGQELMHMLQYNADQPTGQMQLGQYHFSRGNTPEAIRHLETAIRWDPNSRRSTMIWP